MRSLLFRKKSLNILFNKPLPKIQPQTLAVKLTNKGERSVKSKHPWLFSDSVEKINKEGNAGDIAVIFNRTTNKPMGVGLYDPDSPIRIKMLHFGGGAKLNETYFSDKVERAFKVREELLESNTNSYRLLFGENDGFPGLIADVYASVLVLKIYNAIWFPFIHMIFPKLLEITGCGTLVLRLSRGLQTNMAGLVEGEVLYGDLKNEVVQFIEHGVQFSAHVIKGHKTGYFLDHRENRRRVGMLSKGKTMLDVFSYAGGFSIHALAKGATEVTSLDISAQALEVAKENGALNKHKGKHFTIVGDAFVELERLIREGKQYDVVVIDPPSFAKSKREIVVAKKKYGQLAKLGAQLVTKKGLLVLASCSSRITADEFFQINTEILKEHGTYFELIEKTFHDADHPVGFPEGAYLKCGYYRFS
jgi:23S rRNA (cytosine1962-C5)-methyltransferase